MLQATKTFRNGGSPPALYLALGFLVAPVLGFFALNIDTDLGLIKAFDHYTTQQLKYGVYSLLGAVVTASYLFTLTLGIWRFFELHRSWLAAILLVLAVIHFPISLTTFGIFCYSFAVAVYALLLH